MSSHFDETTVASVLSSTYEKFGDKPALLSEDHWFTFAEVAELARGLAVELTLKGVHPGDRVVGYLHNGVPARLLDHAILGFQFVRVALSARLHPSEVAAIAVDAGASVVVCSPSVEDQVREALAVVGSSAEVSVLTGSLTELARLRAAAQLNIVPAPGPVKQNEIVMLMYSSGTTGQPKGVVVTNETWLAQMSNALDNLPTISPRDVVVLGAPMAHFGGSIALDCMMQGASTVIVDPFEPGGLLNAIELHGGTIVPLVPTLLSRLLSSMEARPEAVSTVRAMPYGGSPTQADVLMRATRLLPDALVQFYGLAEALAPLAVLSSEDHREAVIELEANPADSARWLAHLQSAGRWVDGVEYRESEDGELQVRSSTVMPQYWNCPVRADGWFATGDFGYTDDEGYLQLLGRRTDTIISGGFNVQPREVEQVIEQMDQIAEVAVVGLPDERWGEGVHAFVVIDPHASARTRETLTQAIREECLDHIASYKKPVGVHILEVLPRNSFGKVDRATIRALFQTPATSDNRTTAEGRR
ncbi:class I adenylate-forming enzyme family protein [Brevibacterium renqingii]|uniref:class I adenylate-forming enzyme family protein n=1 Tax=Brevibacterium renqingii TaxID=2776916 RepID=UPI001AE070EE|nr:AMP-binding protein [Brevibacterium renqingii]